MAGIATSRLLSKIDIPRIVLPGGSFGRTVLPIPVANEVQGSIQELDIIAGVKYPNGHGETLHYEVASVSLGNRVSFSTPFLNTLSAVALLSGTIITHKHASVKLQFPSGVAEQLPWQPHPRTEIFWTWDPSAQEKIPTLTMNDNYQ